MTTRDDAVSRFPFVAATAALAVFLACAGGVAAFWGLTRLVAPARLSAEVRLDPLVLPSGIFVDPQIVADDLTRHLTEQAERDVAIRMTLGKDNVAKMLEVVFPRLVTSTAIGGMFQRIPSLKGILSLGQFRAAARISVANLGPTRLEDVAMTLPGALVAETADGRALEIHVSKAGPRAVRIGTLEPGARLDFAAWTTSPPDAPGMAEAIRLGAAGGAAGAVTLYAGEGWLGEPLAAQPWARWLVGTVLVSSALTALGVLALIVRGARRPAASNRA